MLVGNPNGGKTTLFNALTGENQHVGNWPGVTVEKVTGHFILEGQSVNVTDLPGVYSLVSAALGASQDEQIAAHAVAYSDEVDVLINVVDACHLERHLYLTSQLLELGKPVIVVLTMVDLALQQGIFIDVDLLSKELMCPVVSVEAHRKKGLLDLHHAILSVNKRAKPSGLSLSFSEPLQQLLQDMELCLLPHCPHPSFAFYLARRILEGDTLLLTKDQVRHAFDRVPPMVDADIVMADARYQAIHQVVRLVQKKRSDSSNSITVWLDRIVLHRFWALPIFFGMMYLMFLLAVSVGGAFQDFFDISSDAIFVQGSAWVFTQLHCPNWLIALLANGLGKGINTTLTFTPVIASMFFFLSLLESSGYMARAAFVVDKIMRVLGLPGKSFVPMIVGFGCNVPAIMAARTLDSEQDRLLTVLMSPFMSCSARLAIYAVFVAAFFPVGGQNIIFSLYLIGIVMAVLTGLLLRNTLFKGQTSPLILELPVYHRPSLQRLLKETMLRLRLFLWRAGKFILPISMLLGGLNALMIDGGISTGEAHSESILSLIGQWLTPLFSPMGLQQDNWPATVGLLTGMLAKEVVVGSLNTLYAQVGHVVQSSSLSFDFISALQSAALSIPKNLSRLGSSLMNPWSVSLSEGGLSRAVSGVLYQHFDGQAGAYAYLLFILLYIPCMSTMAAIRQEASSRLMWLSIIWSLMVAYTVAVVFYQFATMAYHPQQTVAWVLGLSLVMVVVVAAARFLTRPTGRSYVATDS
jgi:ferrous iron transport protein B